MDILYTIGDSFVFRGPQYTTWSKLLANKLNYIHLNSGLLYRAFTYVYFIDNKLSHLDSIDITIFENFS